MRGAALGDGPVVREAGPADVAAVVRFGEEHVRAHYAPLIGAAAAEPNCPRMRTGCTSSSSPRPVVPAFYERENVTVERVEPSPTATRHPPWFGVSGPFPPPS